MIWHRGKRCQLVHFGTSNWSVTLNFKLATRQPTWVECKIFLSGWRMNYSSIAPLLALHAGRFGKRKISSHVCARRSHPQQSSDKVISCWRLFCAQNYTKLQWLSSFQPIPLNGANLVSRFQRPSSAEQSGQCQRIGGSVWEWEAQ